MTSDEPALRVTTDKEKAMTTVEQTIEQRLPEEGETMSSNRRRFVINEEGDIIDTLNPANSGKGQCCADGPQDERYLREIVLQRSLRDLLSKLIINPRPMQKLPNGQEYQPCNEESEAISWPVFQTIRASHLNSCDPAMSIQNRFDGTLKRQKKGMKDSSSLSLFRDDVERLLRDLYGDIEGEALDTVLFAVFYIVQAHTKYVRNDLWKEDNDAVNFDYMFGIGLPEGYGVNGSMWRRGMLAKSDLILRVCEVCANPSAFSEYTVKFANRFSQDWVCSAEAAFKARYPS